MVVAFERFLEAEERIYYFTLVVEDEPFEVVGSRWLVPFHLSAQIQILKSQLIFLLLVVDDPPFLDAHVSHIRLASDGEGFDGFFKVAKFLLADSFADIGEPLGFVDVDGFSEIF